MSKTSFENYWKMARCSNDYIMISGRYEIQATAGKRILWDVIKKLELNPSDSLLEIGCGTGNLLLPLSFFVKNTAGVDHKACLDRLQKRFPGNKNIHFIPGNFLDVSVKGKYTKILCYSVLHYLANESEVYKFIHKTLTILRPGGKILLGDIPNRSVKERFIYSQKGKEFDRKWQKLITKHHEHGGAKGLVLEVDTELVQFNDELILNILKNIRSM